MTTKKETKRCSVCGNMLYSFNKSGLCEKHYHQKVSLERYYKEKKK